MWFFFSHLPLPDSQTKTPYPYLLVTAPGFQTSVAQIRVTPEIAARLRRGERVSPEEIAAASARGGEDRGSSKREPSVDNNEKSTDSEAVKEGATKPKRRGKGRKK